MEPPPQSNRKFAIALGLYCVIGVVAWFNLTGKVRLFLIILLGAFAFKTWIARVARR